MALSDYDHMAFDTEGKPCGSSFTFKSGFRAELYKNWVYLHHPKVYKSLKKAVFINDTVAQINSGSMTIGDIYMHLEHTKDGRGCLVFMYTSNYSKKKTTYEFFSGLAISGWDDEIMVNLKKLGRPESERRDFEWSTSSGFSRKAGKEVYQMLKHDKKTLKTIEEIDIPPTDYDALWLGINKVRLAEFHAFIDRVCDDHGMADYAKSVIKSKALSHNQGDAFIGNALGFKAKQTKAGEKSLPLLSKILVKTKK